MQNFHELIQGFHNFKEDYFLREREFFSSLVHGQSPKTLVVACCDSRVDPAILMGCRPGDLFVARSIAAIVPDVEKAGEHDAVVSAVEYAVKHLDVRNIIVMGHSNCGGIHGLLPPEVVSKEPYISRWLCLAHPVLEELEHEDPDEPADVRARRCEEGTVLQSIDSLLSYDWVKSRVDAGTLALHALYYDLASGTMYVWNAEAEDFEATKLSEL